MAFFQFGRKIEFSKEYSLAEIPVFSSLNPAEQRLIEKKARLVEYKRGDIVYDENTPPDAFYVVVSGRFRLFLKARPMHPEKTLIYFHRGDHFSEVSLLTGRHHSASVEAKRDGLLLKIEKEDFLKLIQDFPAISLYLNRSLGHRLTKVAGATYNHQEVKIATLYSASQSPDAFQFWLDLAGTLVEETKRRVILVDFSSEPPTRYKNEFQRQEFSSFNLTTMDPSRESELKTPIAHHPKGFDYIHIATSDETDRDEKKISTLLTFLTYKFDCVMLRLPGEIDGFTFKALKLSDVVYVYAESSSLKITAQAIKEFQESFGLSKAEIRVIVPDSQEERKFSYEGREEVLGARIFSVIPHRLTQPARYVATLKYIAKEFAGTLLGLALGSGAAYGLAHIGVLRVLEREGILPDVIAGSSIGALVGGLWGAGFEADELEKLAKGIDLKTGFFKLLGFADMSAAHRGFFKGNQVTRFLEGYLGDRTFQDLKIPVKIIAANLFTSEEVIMDSGRVVDAIRASISIPGIFRPLVHKGTYLIDGGVVDPLPVKVLSSMGVKKIIAVNVLPSPKDRIARNRIKEAEAIQKAQLISQKNILNRFYTRGVGKVYNRYADNVFNVIMSTIQFLEYEIAEGWGHQADIFIHPVVQDAHWAEFYSAEKFIRCGEEKTEAQLEEIKKLVIE